MKIGVFLFLGAGVLISAGADQIESEDGLAVFLKAGEVYESLGLKDDPEFQTQLRDYLRTGTAPEEFLANLARAEEVFELVTESALLETWSLPNVSEFSVETKNYWSRDLTDNEKLVRARAIQLHREGRSGEAIALLDSLNSAGMQFIDPGSLIDVLTYIRLRVNQYSILVASADEVSGESLDRIFEEAKRQYSQLPQTGTILDGERYVTMNTVRHFYCDLEKEMENDGKMVQALQEAGVSGEEIAKAREDGFLSIASWESKSLSLLDDIFSIASEYDSLPASRFDEVEQKILEEIEVLGEDMGTIAVSLIVMEYVAGWTDKEISNDKLKNFNTEMGRVITRHLAGILIPLSSGPAVQYEKIIALDRLWLIHLATKIFHSRNSRPPSSLQEMVQSGLLEPEMIVDPMVDEPFKLRSGDSFEAYSVGTDFEDDGGLFLGDSTKSGDLFLRTLEEEWEFNRVEDRND